MDNITYSKAGDYFLPDLDIPTAEKNTTLGRWGMAHKKFLNGHKKGLYSYLLISGKLYQHCKEIEDTAMKRIYLLTKQMALAENVTEELKATDQMAWIGTMNSIRSRAEEIVKSELIYA